MAQRIGKAAVSYDQIAEPADFHGPGKILKERRQRPDQKAVELPFSKRSVEIGNLLEHDDIQTMRQPPDGQHKQQLIEAPASDQRNPLRQHPERIISTKQMMAMLIVPIRKFAG